MKYKEGAKKLLKESENETKEIDKSGKKGKAAVKVQIALLEGNIVEAETEVEEAEEAYNNSKFAVPFVLENVDKAEAGLKKAEAEFEKTKSDLKSRQDLLKELFG